jgi:hypothetical protein
MAKVFGCPGTGRQKYKQSVYTALQLFFIIFFIFSPNKTYLLAVGGGIWKYMTAGMRLPF